MSDSDKASNAPFPDTPSASPGQDLKTYQRIIEFVAVPFKGTQLKELIMSKSIRIYMYHVMVDGLPESGKRSLCQQLGIASESQVPSRGGGAESMPGVDLYEALLSHTTPSNPGHQWINFIDLKEKDGSAVDILALGLLYFLIGQHQLPQLEAVTEVDAHLFDDAKLQEYFSEMCTSLQKLSAQFTSHKNSLLQKLLTGPWSLVNIFHIFENKPMREVMQTVRGQHSNMLLVDLINISKYDKEKVVKDVSGSFNEKFFGSPLHHFGASIESASHEKPLFPRCIVVGTHIDKLNKEEVQERSRDIMKLVETKASDMKVPPAAIYKDMITLDTRNVSQCNQVTNAIVSIVTSNKNIFEIDIPLKFLFLRWYLHKIKQKFMTRAELISHGKKCGVEDGEIDKFLELFRACGSIISSEIQQHFLHDNFIMFPVEFLKELFRLYTMKEDGTIPHEYLASTVNGIVSVCILKSLWQGQAGEISVSDFFIKALNNFGMLAEIGNDEFYIPSLKNDYDASDINSDSLIITADMPYISLRRQVEFVKYFRNNQTLSETINFLPSAGPGNNFCNVTYFKFGLEEVKIKVRVSFQHIEVSFLEINYRKPESYSVLKTALVDIMNNICRGRFRFYFNILCPNKEDKEHFMSFEISDSTVDKCPKCQSTLNVKDKKLSTRVLWIQAAYQGSLQSLLHHNDILNPRNILKICESLLKKSNSSDRLIKISQKLAERSNAPSFFSLDQSSFRHRSPEDILFHAIYIWSCSNVRSSAKTLAHEIMENGYYNEAYTIDPTLYNKPDQNETSVLLTDKQLFVISDWWPVEPSNLAKILKVKLHLDDSMTDAQQCTAYLKRWIEDNPTGNQLQKLISILGHNEYHIPTEYFTM